MTEATQNGNGPYTYKTAWQDLSYECEFLAPAFDLARGGLDVLSALYGALGSRFPLKPSDLRMIGGVSLADVRVQASAFSGLAKVEIGVDRFVCQVNGVQTPNDFATAREFIGLASSSVLDGLRNPTVSRSVLSVAAFLEVERLDDVPGFLSGFISANLKSSIQNLDSDSAKSFGLILDVGNANQGWKGRLRVERSAVDSAQLFVAANAEFAPDSPIVEYDRRFEFGSELLARALVGFGLVPNEDAEE